ncbi:MAG TPA: glycosyltransferase family 4 protein [Vicinamibacterales bacterium]
MTMRVAITARSVFPLHGLGGLERSVYDLARHLVREGVRVTLITRPATHPGDVHPEISIQFVPYRTFPFAGRKGTTVVDRSTAYPRFGVRAGEAAATLVARGEIDIVHGFGASVLGYARQRARSGAPLVLNPQGMEEFGATDPSHARLKRLAYLPLRRAVRECAAAADAVIATDRALVPVVRRHLGVAGERIATIPNALDLENLDALATPADGAAIRSSSGVQDDLVLLSVGRIEENKGFHLLAQALAALREHSGRLAGGRWRWVLVGDGPHRGRLESLIDSLGLARHVVLAGRVPDPDLHAWYEAADLFVHPTLYEGSSLVTLEAMAHRRACVVTDAGGLPDKVRNGVNGWIVPAGDPAALTAALSGALEDPVRLQEMGAAGRRIVEEEFSWKATVRQTLALYDRLLRRP